MVSFIYATPNLALAASHRPLSRAVGSATASSLGVQVIFRQEPKVSGSLHFGCRLAFSPHGTLFVTLGERFKFEAAQDLTNDLGKIVRINRDGSVPPDNAFVNQAGVRPEIRSYGHRNIQGAAFHPETGVLWISELRTARRRRDQRC